MVLSRAAEIMGGVLNGQDAKFKAVSTDSRSINSGELFFAIQGEKSDGHDYLDQVHKNHAAGAVVSRTTETNLPTIEVADTTKALGQLGSDWRMAFDIPVIAITGSNGKTTVTSLVASILSREGGCLHPEKSFNNQWGVPLTLLKLNSNHRFAVIEMGMNHPGEIEYLSALTRPTVALVNNIGAAHLEGLGSVEAIARAKSEIYSGLQAGGTVVINRDDAFQNHFRQLALELDKSLRIIQFGLDNPGDITARNLRYESGRTEFELVVGDRSGLVSLPLPGRHNVMNALAAATVCHSLDLDIESIAAGLGEAAAVSGRLVARQGARGSTLIDDSYNANPVSIKAGIDVLAGYNGKRILVLGHMAELGEASAELHRQVGKIAAIAGIDSLFVLASEGHEFAREYAAGFGTQANVFESIETLVPALKHELDDNTTVLVKGSRSSRMERVVSALVESEKSETREVKPC